MSVIGDYYKKLGGNTSTEDFQLKSTPDIFLWALARSTFRLRILHLQTLGCLLFTLEDPDLLKVDISAVQWLLVRIINYRDKMKDGRSVVRAVGCTISPALLPHYTRLSCSLIPETSIETY